jgi:hypothetical protein
MDLSICDKMSPYLIQITREYLAALVERRALLDVEPVNTESMAKLLRDHSRINDKIASHAAVLYAHGIVDRQGNLVEDKRD